MYHPLFVIQDMKKESTHLVNSLRLGFTIHDPKLRKKMNEDMENQEQLIDPDIIGFYLRKASNIFTFKEKYAQYYQVSVESLMGTTGLSMFHMKEYLVTWPKIQKPKFMKHHRVTLIGMKLYMTRESLQ